MRTSLNTSKITFLRIMVSLLRSSPVSMRIVSFICRSSRALAVEPIIISLLIRPLKQIVCPVGFQFSGRVLENHSKRIIFQKAKRQPKHQQPQSQSAASKAPEGRNDNNKRQQDAGKPGGAKQESIKKINSPNGNNFGVAPPGLPDTRLCFFRHTATGIFLRIKGYKADGISSPIIIWPSVREKLIELLPPTEKPNPKTSRHHKAANRSTRFDYFYEHI